MKITLKIEDGKPLIIFEGELSRDKNVQVWTAQDGHNWASRSYLRALPSPETAAEKSEAWRALGQYSRLDPM